MAKEAEVTATERMAITAENIFYCMQHLEDAYQDFATAVDEAAPTDTGRVTQLLCETMRKFY